MVVVSVVLSIVSVVSVVVFGTNRNCRTCFPSKKRANGNTHRPVIGLVYRIAARGDNGFCFVVRIPVMLVLLCVVVGLVMVRELAAPTSPAPAPPSASALLASSAVLWGGLVRFVVMLVRCTAL